MADKAGIGISLDTERDADILKWHDANKGKISALVREAIRETYLQGDERDKTEQKILNGIRRIESLIQSGKLSVSIHPEDAAQKIVDESFVDNFLKTCDDVGWD